jgi:hypothetical protein
MLEYWPQEFVLCNHNPKIVVKHLGGLYNFLKTVFTVDIAFDIKCFRIQSTIWRDLAGF